MEAKIVKLKEQLKRLKDLQSELGNSLGRAKVTKLDVLIDMARRQAQDNEKAIEYLTKIINEEEERL